MHESDHTVSSEGTIELRGLTPGQRVHVVVQETHEDEAENQEVERNIAMIKHALAQHERGESRSAEAFFDELRDKLLTKKRG